MPRRTASQWGGSILSRPASVLLAALLTLAQHCPADDTLLSVLSARNQSITAIHGRFEQHKTIAVLPLPLRSSGRFDFQRGAGIHWQFEQPIDSTLRITAQGIQWAEQPQQTADTAASTMAGSIFLGLISGDMETIANLFEIQAAGQPRRWALTLRPLSDALAAYIDRIVLSGAELTERVLVIEHNGDRTRIDFTADAVTRE